jgi:hypothetical protein
VKFTGKLITDMRLAFVIRLGNDSRPATGHFEGWVEEVDSCVERRFRTTEELLAFLGRRFDLASGATESTEAEESERTLPGALNRRRGKKST